MSSNLFSFQTEAISHLNHIALIHPIPGLLSYSI